MGKGGFHGGPSKMLKRAREEHRVQSVTYEEPEKKKTRVTKKGILQALQNGTLSLDQAQQQSSDSQAVTKAPIGGLGKAFNGYTAQYHNGGGWTLSSPGGKYTDKVPRASVFDETFYKHLKGLVKSGNKVDLYHEGAKNGTIRVPFTKKNASLANLVNKEQNDYFFDEYDEGVPEEERLARRDLRKKGLKKEWKENKKYMAEKKKAKIEEASGNLLAITNEQKNNMQVEPTPTKSRSKGRRLADVKDMPPGPMLLDKKERPARVDSSLGPPSDYSNVKAGQKRPGTPLLSRGEHKTPTSEISTQQFKDWASEVDSKIDSEKAIKSDRATKRRAVSLAEKEEDASAKVGGSRWIGIPPASGKPGDKEREKEEEDGKNYRDDPGMASYRSADRAAGGAPDAPRKPKRQRRDGPSSSSSSSSEGGGGGVGEGTSQTPGPGSSTGDGPSSSGGASINQAEGMQVEDDWDARDEKAMQKEIHRISAAKMVGGGVGVGGRGGGGGRGRYPYKASRHSRNPEEAEGPSEDDDEKNSEDELEDRSTDPHAFDYRHRKADNLRLLSSEKQQKGFAGTNAERANAMQGQYTGYYGPYNYPDLDDTTLKLLGGYRSNQGNASQLWESRQNANGKSGKVRKYWKWSNKNQNWKKLANRANADRYLSRSSRGHQSLRLPNTMKFQDYMENVKKSMAKQGAQTQNIQGENTQKSQDLKTGKQGASNATYDMYGGGGGSGSKQM
jgi:hypothetical protein